MTTHPGWAARHRQRIDTQRLGRRRWLVVGHGGIVPTFLDAARGIGHEVVAVVGRDPGLLATVAPALHGPARGPIARAGGGPIQRGGHTETRLGFVLPRPGLVRLRGFS